VLVATSFNKKKVMAVSALFVRGALRQEAAGY